jgi:hypothetical protein
MLVTRGHFFIDLISGAIFADYIYKEVDKYYPKAVNTEENDVNV